MPRYFYKLYMDNTRRKKEHIHILSACPCMFEENKPKNKLIKIIKNLFKF